jgi:uncharacterized protein YcnI
MKDVMKNSIIYQWATACTLCVFGTTSFAHVVLDEPAALANTSYRATLRVGHGCDGSPVTALRVSIPEGFSGAKPMPKAGWILTTKLAKLAKPYTSHGKTITEDVAEINWTAVSKEYWLPEAWYDEFVLRGGLPNTAGPMWFKVTQACEKGSIDWAEIPTVGTSTKGLKFPAVQLDVVESSPVAHQH